MNDHPDLEVIINVLKSYDIGEEVSAGRADLALTRTVSLQTNIKSDIVHEESVILVGPHEWKEAFSLDEQTALQKYRLITHNLPDY
jgi:LysR family transcriptional regulator, repressor for citA